jgi:hypothetical protein
MNLIPKDTTIDALRKQFEILERIGMEGRAEMTAELNDNLRQLIEDGIRLRHPEYNDFQVFHEVIRITAGDEIYNKLVKPKNENK